MAIFRDYWFRLINFGFYLLYHQLAPIYDLVSWVVSFGQWRSWQLAALPFIEGPDVMELAHGPGHMLIALQQAGYQVTGVDLSPQMGRLAMQKIHTVGAAVSILQAPAQKLPIASGSFKTVLATFPTEFIADRNSLHEIHRVLQKNGRLVIVPQARLTGESAVVGLLEWLYRITGQRNVPQEGSEQNNKSSLFNDMKGRFKEAGFSLHTERIPQRGSEVIVVIAVREDT